MSDAEIQYATTMPVEPTMEELREQAKQAVAKTLTPPPVRIRTKTAPLRITTLEMPARPPRPSPVATTLEMAASPPPSR